MPSSLRIFCSCMFAACLSGCLAGPGQRNFSNPPQLEEGHSSRTGSRRTSSSSAKPEAEDTSKIAAISASESEKPIATTNSSPAKPGGLAEQLVVHPHSSASPLAESTPAAEAVIAAADASVDSEAISRLLLRLESLRGVSREHQEEIRLELQQANPQLRALLVRQLESELDRVAAEQAGGTTQAFAGTITATPPADVSPAQYAAPVQPNAADGSNPLRSNTPAPARPQWDDQSSNLLPETSAQPTPYQPRLEAYAATGNALRQVNYSGPESPANHPAEPSVYNLVSAEAAARPVAQAAYSQSEEEAQINSAAPPASVKNSEEPRHWREHLNLAVAALQQEPAEGASEHAELLNALRLRMLQLVAGRNEAALQTVSALDAHQQDYWKAQLHALAVQLEPDDSRPADRRALLALQHLKSALNELAAASPLEVKNLTFCSRVDGFGRTTPFPGADFAANQEVLLYAEIENFSSSVTSKGYETSLQGSYQITDASGRRWAEFEFPLETEVCESRRRDFFIPYRLYIPKDLPAGKYQLTLSVEDVKAGKFGQGAIAFSVVR